jgi:hypothetical protein
MAESVMDAPDGAYAASFGLSTNQNGGTYENGNSYDMSKRLEVLRIIERRKNEGKSTSSRMVAAEAKVGPTFVRKVVKDGTIEAHTNRKMKQSARVGPGCLSLNDLDFIVLVHLLRANPQRSLRSYVRELYKITGTLVHETTISRVWKGAFRKNASLVKPNMIPRDKFKPENIQKAREYINIVSQLNPVLLKFTDEKHLKGEEIYNGRARKDPITGVRYNIRTQSDLRNAYSIIGFCGIDMRTAPFFFHFGKQTNDSAAFGEAVDDAIARGFLKEGDVLIMDNASIHRFKENEVLEEYLWEEFGIFMLTLPTRSPEMNPIELLWNTLVSRMKCFFVDHSDKVPIHLMATRIMDRFRHEDVFKAFKKCGYINK